eukprot:COSAG01_NODE_7282_length_3273_cov_2.089792_2_plen_319_part_00
MALVLWLRADWFCALGGQGPCLFAHPTSGLLHFSRTHFNGSDWIAQPRPGANRSACTRVRRRAHACPPPVLYLYLYLWLAAGSSGRRACRSVGRLAQSARIIAGEWVPGAAQTVERLSAYRCSHRPHGLSAPRAPPNACLSDRPSVSGGVAIIVGGPLQLLRSRGGGLPGRRGAALAQRRCGRQALRLPPWHHRLQADQRAAVTHGAAELRLGLHLAACAIGPPVATAVAAHQVPGAGGVWGWAGSGRAATKPRRLRGTAPAAAQRRRSPGAAAVVSLGCVMTALYATPVYTMYRQRARNGVRLPQAYMHTISDPPAA